MKIERLVLGAIQTNTYFVTNEVTKECVVIDPAEDIQSISGFISFSLI